VSTVTSVTTTAATAAAATPRGYSSVRVVGSLLTADLIGRIGSGDPQLKGLRSEDYGLVPGRRLGEAASRRWEELLGVYRAFQQQLAKAGPDESLVTLTRERWLLPLFDALGFGRLQYRRGGLTAEGRTFPVSHLWHNVPVHLVAWGRDLDKKRGGNGSAGGDRAPQSMLQDFLNSSEAHLWGIVSNGQKLRLLRDAASLAEAAFVEFDLESMFDGELYSDFVLLFALAHASRFEPHTPEAEEEDEGRAPAKASVADCWIERWRVEGDRTGIRFRDKLRDGLQAALEELGTGFLEANEELREKLRAGEVSRHDLRDELLRLAYQLLFLFVAEDKGALLDPDADEAARERYRTYFSTQRLRRIALERVGDRHDDLWRTLLIVLDALGSDEGRKELALPALGGLYFTAEALEDGEARPELLRGEGITLSNQRLLAAVRHLTRVRDGSGRWQQVDYQHLDAEELGSVYESLLELVPYPDSETRTFELRSAAGNDRKTTGSYYTPSSLVETLLDSALNPVIERYSERGVPDDLLKITVCDPACGSGHFLVAAARRIARAYAVLEAGDEEPTPDAITRAMPKVVRHCIYGVDLNPLAVELTKVSLWLASLEPGKPLAFLDGHIKVGNALLGATPKLLDAGIPDGAFKVLEGDDKKFAAGLRTRNRQELKALRRDDGSTQDAFWSRQEIIQSNAKLVESIREINRATQPGLVGIREQARKFRNFEASPEKQQRKRVADAWCAAFVWPKRPDAPDGVTTKTLLRIDQGLPLMPGQQEMIDNLVQNYHFFHWHLEFPEVFPGIDEDAEDYNPETGWQGGFTCVLGNPPWDQIQLDAREFFASLAPDIAKAPTMAARNKMIERLKQDDPHLYGEYADALRKNDGIKHFVHASGRFPLTSYGRLNTYSLFTETARFLISPSGLSGVIVPTGIATDSFNQHFFREIVEHQKLVTVYDFENRKKLFPAVDSRVKFTILTLAGRAIDAEKIKFAFFLHDTSEISNVEKRFTLSSEEILTLNPNTGTCPVFRSRRDAEITLDIYRKFPVLINKSREDGNPWDVSFQLMFMMNTDSHRFRTREDLEADGWRLEGNVFVRGEERMLPLYEAKMLHHYDHRWATYETSESARDVTLEEKKDAEALVLPRYWVPEEEIDEQVNKTTSWLTGFRKICRSTDERTLVSYAFPKSGLGDSGNIIQAKQPENISLYANTSSFSLDYVLRQKLGGTNLNFFQFEQLPILRPQDFRTKASWDSINSVHKWLSPRVLELTYTAWDMEPFARDLGDSGAPFVWDDERRFLIRCELDAAFFHLYGIERDDVAYIMETFPIVKKKDLQAHGSYRTKDTILDIYDAMAKAIETGEPYQTVLDPPPGEGPRHPARD